MGNFTPTPSASNRNTTDSSVSRKPQEPQQPRDEDSENHPLVQTTPFRRAHTKGVETFISCYRTPGPQKVSGGVSSEGVSEGGPHPQYGWDFPEEIPEKFRKDPGNALRAFLGSFPREYGWDAQNPIIQGIWGSQSISRIISPPVWLGTPLFSEMVPERASQSWSWNSQQYWGYFWEGFLKRSSYLSQPKDPSKPPSKTFQEGRNRWYVWLPGAWKSVPGSGGPVKLN